MYENMYKNEQGFVMISALAIVALLLALAGAAMIMSELGHLSLSSEKRYQLANWAAEYAVYDGVNYAVEYAACPPNKSGTVGTGFNQANYIYYSVAAADYCFIHGKGSIGNGSVVKTLVVPKTAAWGGMVTRGGTINLQGNAAAIAGCDTSDTSSCGIMPGVISGSELGGNYGTTATTTCAANPVGGLVGSPPMLIDPSLGDLFARYFDVTDTDSDGVFWDDLQNTLSAKFGIDAAGLTSDGTDAACQFTCTTATSCTITLPASCDNKKAYIACTGSCSPSATNLLLQGSLNNKTIVSDGHIYIDSNMANTNVFSNNITLDLTNETVAGGTAGSTLYAAGTITAAGNGGRNIGTASDPLIILAGNSFAAGGSGNSTLCGLIATNGTGMEITGSYEIKGALINNSTSALLNNTGNADIKFNMGILKEVYAQFGNPFKRPTCGGGNINSTIQNTKLTVY
ncbi:MAG: hypothetical protein K8I29_11525 [Alphaproteobacteria bacterium]|uniref:Uncharacterized protein n=1 Tax=Candidatus Nitrobium versatile TaxID=2884831 RepID=A0A953J5P1_9BACT|nr:hypothetical protein [Candidatus Nitrobium versatile]